MATLNSESAAIKISCRHVWQLFGDGGSRPIGEES